MTAPAATERVYTPRILAVFGATMLYFGVAGVAFPVLPRLVERELGGGSAEIGLAFGRLACSSSARSAATCSTESAADR